MPSVAVYLLPPVIAKFQRLYPAVELHLTEASQAQVLDAVQQGTVDFGILGLPVLDSQLHSVWLMRDEFVLLVPRGHHLAGRQTIPFAEFANERFILFPKGGRCPAIQRPAPLCNGADTGRDQTTGISERWVTSTPVNVKLCESPGTAGGLPFVVRGMGSRDETELWGWVVKHFGVPKSKGHPVFISYLLWLTNRHRNPFATAGVKSPPCISIVIKQLSSFPRSTCSSVHEEVQGLHDIQKVIASMNHFTRAIAACGVYGFD